MTNNQTIQLKDILINGGEIKAAAKVIRAINHPFRQQVLKLINDAGEITVTDLYTAVGCEQSEISQCAAILRKQGIVLTRRSGKFIFYRIDYTRLHYIVELIGKLNK